MIEAIVAGNIMSDTSNPVPHTAPTPTASLADLRSQLDTLDDRLHDLLMARAQVVDQITRLNAKGGVPLRPGREASILYRLLDRHQGRMPPQAVIRVWRELLAGSTAMQGGYGIAVADASLLPLTREHFGALTPLQLRDGTRQALADLGRTASAALLPWPGSAHTESGWWRILAESRLATPEAPHPSIVARLPFRVEGTALSPVSAASFSSSDPLVAVVSTSAPDPSGRDRTLLALMANDDFTVATACAKAGLKQPHPLHREGQWVLIEVEGFLTPDAPALHALADHSPVIIGAYACAPRLPAPDTSP